MTQGHQNGNSDSRQTIQVEEGYATTYSLSKPPEKLRQLLYELARATKGPVYRKHGVFPDSKELRSVIASATGRTKGDADNIARFLKKVGCLTSREGPDGSGERWAFDGVKADELIAQIAALDPSITLPHIPFAEIASGRPSDPGAPPPPPVPEEPKAAAADPFAHLAGLEDDLLDLHDQDLQNRKRDIEAELEAVGKEWARRIAARREQIAAHKKALELEEQRLADLAALKTR